MNKLLVITSFPPKGKTHAPKVVGIASYAKNTLLGLAKVKKDLSITVLAEKLPGTVSEYKDEGMQIRRIWKRNSWNTFPNLVKEIFQNFKDTKTVLIEFEFAMFGSYFHMLLFPLFLLTLRLMGKKTVVVLHQVIARPDDIKSQINISNHFVLAVLIAIAKEYYKAITDNATTVVVFDEVLKRRIVKNGAENVVVIPHGIEQFPTQDKLLARKKLKIAKDAYVLMSFGFLAWYKGTDWLIDAFAKVKRQQKGNKKLTLIIAGGPNPNHIFKHFYKSYIRRIEEVARENEIIVTGFIPQEKINLYFAASDLVIFPYRTFMSSSGPLSMTFSFRKPFVVSEKLADMLKTKDMAAAIAETKLDKRDITFSFEEGLGKAIERFEKNRMLNLKVLEFTKKLSAKRSWYAIGRAYYEVLFG